MLFLLAQIASPVTHADGDPTSTGSIYIALLGLLSVGLVALMAFVAAWLAQKAKDSKAARVLLKLWETTQAIVAHVDVQLRPTLSNALADGKLTPDEKLRLKAEALRLLKEALGEQGLAGIRSVLGLAGPSVEVFLSGMIERALGVHKALEASVVAVSPGIAPPVGIIAASPSSSFTGAIANP